MKTKILFTILISLINCQIPLKDGEILEFHKNYTLIPPIGGRVKIYYLEPHFEVGTVDFIIYFSNRALSCTYEFFDGNTLVDKIAIHYTPFLTYTLTVPAS